MRRCETENPHSPALGLPPRPVAPSSRIAPPAPVDAPANGEIAVGWLWVSTLTQNALSRVGSARYAFVRGSGRKRFAGYPSTTAALSLYADSVYCGVWACVCLIILNSVCGASSRSMSCPSMVHEALTILCRRSEEHTSELQSLMR